MPRRTLASLLGEIPTHLKNTAYFRTGAGSPEAAQAWIRLGIVPLLIGYAVAVLDTAGLATVIHSEALVLGVLSVSLAGSTGILFSVLRSPTPSTSRRIVTYAHDYLALGLILFLSQHTLFWLPVIWLSVGNGIRFGRTDAIISSALGVSLVGVMGVASPSWARHSDVLALVASILVLVPIYVALMASARAKNQTKEHQIALDLQASQLNAIAENEAEQARKLSSSIERHRATLVALTRELREPAIAMRNTLAKHRHHEASRDALRHNDLLLATLATIEDIDAIVEGTIDVVEEDVTASAFARTLVDRLRLVAPGPVTYEFQTTEEGTVQMRLDTRWVTNAIYAAFRPELSSGHRGDAFHVDFEIDGPNREKGSAFLTVTLHPASGQKPTKERNQEHHLAIDVCRRILAVLGGKYVSILSPEILAQVEIPVIAGKMPRAIQSHPAPQTSRAREKIVIIDDNATVRSTMALFADKLGYRALPILHPNRALSAIAKHHPRFVFIDRHMPILSGRELIQLIRETPGISATTELILFSSDSDESAISEAAELGVRFLKKPIGFETLRDILVEPIPARH